MAALGPNSRQNSETASPCQSYISILFYSGLWHHLVKTSFRWPIPSFLCALLCFDDGHPKRHQRLFRFLAILSVFLPPENGKYYDKKSTGNEQLKKTQRVVRYRCGAREFHNFQAFVSFYL